ncbi:hypothetical protein EAG_04995 [Camponotus floridanus]|uniref:Uncharacterized protein n=1 Tax=Camponotus floridanus TaxID=104421 RepID=E2ARW5_CAMFO|nr:hypothetical protein EAG_04995 [Camponotus floridanus]
MSERGDSDVDATEEINVDDSDSRSCSPRNYASHDGRHVSQETSECSTSPPPSQTGARTLPNDSSRSHPFSISRLLGDSGVRNPPKSPSSEEPDSDKERKWSWEEGNNNNNNNQTSLGGVLDDGRRSWGHDAEEKLSEKDDDDSTPDTRANSSSSIHCASAADLLAPFRLFPTGTNLIYTGGGVIRVPAHRPPGANGAPSGALPAQALIPPWSLQALQHSQQQAAAAGLHRASLLANLAAHPLQPHPHLKDRLAVTTQENGSDDDPRAMSLRTRAWKNVGGPATKYSADIAFPKISIQLSDLIFDFQIGNSKIINYFLKQLARVDASRANRVDLETTPIWVEIRVGNRHIDGKIFPKSCFNHLTNRDD